MGANHTVPRLSGRAFAAPKDIRKGILGWVLGLFALAVSTVATNAQSTELVMFDEAGCVWCAKFKREIGPIYPKTEEGRRAPLRIVDISQASRSGVRLQRAVTSTPTFILSHANIEIGRITGYPGEDFFWGLLGELLARLPLSDKEKSPTAPLDERRTRDTTQPHQILMATASLEPATAARLQPPPTLMNEVMP